MIILIIISVIEISFLILFISGNLMTLISENRSMKSAISRCRKYSVYLIECSSSCFEQNCKANKIVNVCSKADK